MTISYEVPQEQVGTGNVSPFLSKLKEINESFQQEGLSILNEGYVEVAQNKHQFNNYVQKLSEGLDTASAAQFEILANNSRQVFLESTLGGINPVSALSLPLLRVAFAKTAVREGLPTEPVLQPKFKVSWFRPFVQAPGSTTKVYLPAALTTGGVLSSMFKLPRVAQGDLTLTAGSLVATNLFAGVTGVSVAAGDEVDPVFRVSVVKMTVLDTAGANGEAKVIDVNIPLDTNIDIASGVVTGTHSSGAVNTSRIFVKVDRQAATADIVTIPMTANSVPLATGVPTVTAVQVIGYVSSQANNKATSVGFDVTSEETTIGTGNIIESPINIQQLTDTMAMYNIDSTVRTLEIMSTTLAQATDIDGVNFIQTRYTQSPVAITDTFDVVPAVGYALGNTAWREEMKIKVDKLVTKLMQSTKYTSGMAVIFGNPIDTQLISNVRWTYAPEEQPNGVNIEYRIGTYQSGITTYRVLSSFNFPQGNLYICFLPSAPDQKTVVYYPYSFNLVRGAQSSNTPNLPALQMIKRYVFKEYASMIAKLVISNNA